jgi:tetratricopeptide (TPR) repeat protein
VGGHHRQFAIAAFATAWLGACGAGGSTHGTSHGTEGTGPSGGSSATPASVDAAAPSDASSAAASPDGGSASSAGFIMPSGPQAEQAAQVYNEGATAYAHGDFPTAARSFEHAYQLFPAPAMAYNLARVYERMGEADQAIRYFTIVQHANPTPEQQTDIEHRIAGLHAYEQRRRDGIAQSLPTTDALSQEGNTWFQHGVAFYRRHNYTQALMAFEQAYQYLQTAELFYNLAVTHRALHNIDRALEFMREYLDARRGTPEEAWIQEQVRQLEAQRH